MPFNGVSHSFRRNDVYSGTSYFPFPNSGKLKSLTVSLTFDVTRYLYGNKYYDVVMSPVGGKRQWHRNNGKYIHYVFSELNTPVKKGQNASIYIHGINWAQAPDFNINYSGVIEIPAYEKQEGYVEWGNTNCP